MIFNALMYPTVCKDERGDVEVFGSPGGQTAREAATRSVSKMSLYAAGGPRGSYPHERHHIPGQDCTQTKCTSQVRAICRWKDGTVQYSTKIFL